MNTRKKFLKKKKREEVVKKKKLLIRTATQKEKKEKELQERRHQAAYDMTNGKAEPIMSPEAQKKRDENKKVKITRQLERNLKILKALEEEHEREQAAKKAINEKLEAEGCLTLKEKLDFIAKQNVPENNSENISEKS